jgi:hypothetical protein
MKPQFGCLAAFAQANSPALAFPGRIPLPIKSTSYSLDIINGLVNV